MCVRWRLQGSSRCVSAGSRGHAAWSSEEAGPSCSLLLESKLGSTCLSEWPAPGQQVALPHQPLSNPGSLHLVALPMAGSGRVAKVRPCPISDTLPGQRHTMRWARGWHRLPGSCCQPQSRTTFAATQVDTQLDAVRPGAPPATGLAERPASSLRLSGHQCLKQEPLGHGGGGHWAEQNTAAGGGWVGRVGAVSPRVPCGVGVARPA